jgi:hypothetical protein
MRHLVLIAVTVIGLVALSASPAEAGAAGTWKSTTGNTFLIPDASGDFDIVKQGTDGSRELLRAKWVSGMTGTQFQYVSNKITCTATFNLKDPDMLRVVCGSDPASVWTRIVEARTGRGLIGTWVSTSGNTFLIPEKSSNEFDIVITYTTGKKEILKARWIDGMVGTQFTYGNPANTGTRNGEDRDQIRVVGSKGEVTIWQRQGTRPSR